MGIRIRMERVGTKIGTALSCDYHARFRMSVNFCEAASSTLGYYSGGAPRYWLSTDLFGIFVFILSFGATRGMAFLVFGFRRPPSSLRVVFRRRAK
jgi:hypothetical protein